MFEADTFVLSPNMKTHIWIRRDGCIITTMTSLPIDLADARRDSWQHGTKLVWAAVPSVVRCHDRGGSDYLDDCPPPPARLFLGWLAWCWSVRRMGRRWGILEMKGWIDQGPVFASPQLPLSIVARRLGPLIEHWTFIQESLDEESVQIRHGYKLVLIV